MRSSKALWQVRRGSVVFAETSSGHSSFQPNSDITPSSHSSISTSLLEAFRVPPEVPTVEIAEDWPTDGGVKAESFDSGITSRFFNREYELEYLRKRIQRAPEQPILLVGPRNCGKTALMKRIQEQEGTRILVLNCGLKSVKTPELMAHALREMASKLPSSIGWKTVRTAIPRLGELSKLAKQFIETIDNGTADMAGIAGQVLTDYMKIFFPENTSTDLTAVMDSYELLLKSTTAGDVKTVIVIDEINALKFWKATETNALSDLLQFLKRICKEVGAAHLILATSESFMVSWLDKNGFPGDLRKVEVLGDLTREEALRFVRGGGTDSSGKEWPGLISEHEDIPVLRKEDWEKVWAVCGGNMHLLRVCVKEAGDSGDWGKAVSSVLRPPSSDVATALLRPEQIPVPEGGSPARFTAADYTTAVRLITQARPYHAVPQLVLEAELAKGSHVATGVSGNDVLTSMIEYNLLTVRPYSEMARDLPRELFFRTKKGEEGDEAEEEDSLVMMPSPAHLHAALKKSRWGLLG